MSRSSREKGKRGERELAGRLRELGVSEAHRGQQYHGGTDSPDVVGMPGVHIECKRVERLRLHDAMVQSQGDANGSGDVPVVMHRRNGEPWYVTLGLEDFVSLYRAAKGVE